MAGLDARPKHFPSSKAAHGLPQKPERSRTTRRRRPRPSHSELRPGWAQPCSQSCICESRSLA
eukprot:8927361-Alexandrium_andersonii.AAC.1